MRLLGFFAALGLAPLCMGFFDIAGHLSPSEWMVWVMFYALMSILLMILVITKDVFLSKSDMYKVLVLNILIAASVILKSIPLPLGMSLAFIFPILTACVIGPAYGVIVGGFSIIFSALLFGGVGPWLSMQLYLVMMMSLLLFWVPPRIRRHIYFVIGYGSLWGLLFGFLMTLYFWPMTGMIYGLEAPNQSFISFYLATSFVWDSFRALGHLIFLYLFFEPFKKMINSTGMIR